MNYQTLFNIVLGLGAAVFGWFARMLWQDIKSVTSALAEFRVEIAKNYVPRNDFKEFSSEIREMFNKVMDKLDNKADK